MKHLDVSYEETGWEEFIKSFVDIFENDLKTVSKANGMELSGDLLMYLLLDVRNVLKLYRKVIELKGWPTHRVRIEGMIIDGRRLKFVLFPLKSNGEPLEINDNERALLFYPSNRLFSN